MSKSYKEITSRISKNAATFAKENPNVMQGFRQLSSSAIADGVLSSKQKEFIALAIGVAQRCDGCIGFHVKKLIELGATREEIVEALGVNVYMGGGPALMYVAEALHAYDEFKAG
ncbi:MAG TPA: carboxymuconolactone decarboxylase family protein [Kiritimatiellia bacterium]|nr:carboxymuconolactone decarboxylase family protein [Kiritimatiellia bacterium]HMP00220.1 carboxymuconolactone decarboxylase family protein [Kiritimatiellia bacterium]HMP96850.1 carboxymuconolactone decarboxylase family protein [Kiritimatiellia bacterium]